MTTIRALEGTTITKDQVIDLECFVCGDKLNFDPEKLDKAVEHCGMRYGISSLTPIEPPLRIDVTKLPDELKVKLKNKLSNAAPEDKEEKALEREEEEQAASAKKEKASVQTKTTTTSSSRKK